MDPKMSANKGKGPIIDPGLCRCCGAMKKCRILNVEYDFYGKTEVYTDMFVDCFGLILSHIDSAESERLICATCVVRLRDAHAFRAQVLDCEQKLLCDTIQVHDAEMSDKKPKLEMEVKDEDVLSNSDSQDTQDDANSADDTTEHITRIDIKIEPQNQSEGPSTRLRSRTSTMAMKNSTKAVQMKRSSKDAVQVKYKKDMLQKLKEMKQKLRNIQDTGQPKLRPNPQRPVSVDKDLNGLRNTVTIVENSYVCPFVTVFSDYYCVYCREMFTNPEQLREHTLTHDPKTYKSALDTKKLIQIDIERIDCRLCEEKIDRLEVFKSHITSVHGKHIYSDTNNEFMKFKLKYGTLTCIECEKTFSFFHALKKHMAEHFGTYICDVCGAHYFEERHLIFHKKSHSSKKDEVFPCAECDKTFRSKGSRNFHVARIHKNEAAYPCNKCDEVFISYHVRYRHKIDVHGEQRCYPCESCPKTFDSRKALREHNQKYHLQLRRHECNLCDKKFYLPSALRDHMTSHTGERNFRCEYCGKNYSRAKALKVHLQSHDVEKKYKCGLCPRSYTQVTNYKNHMRTKHPLPIVNGEYD